MKTFQTWNDTPCIPADTEGGKWASAPYICRIAPGMNAVAFDFTDPGAGAKDTHTLYWRIRGEADFREIPLDREMHGQLYGLRPRTDTEFFVVRDKDGCESVHRFACASVVPGKAVAYLHPEDDAYAFSGNFLSSPCLCRLASGRLLASADIRDDGSGRDALTFLFFSDDDGASWQYLTELYPCCRGQLFERCGRLYMLAQSGEGGDLLIGVSDNEGREWQMPTVLFPGKGGFLREPVCLTEADGRLWTDVCLASAGTGERLHAVLSVSADCENAADPAAWTLSDGMPAETACCGNPVRLPDGTLTDVIPDEGGILTARIDLRDPAAAPVLTGRVPLPIGAVKTGFVRDPVTGDCFMLGCRLAEEYGTRRNLLSLFRSRDLVNWTFLADVIDAKALNPDTVGFQTPSMLIDGDDLLFLSRTAYGKPRGFRYANYITFHRIAGFRDL